MRKTRSEQPNLTGSLLVALPTLLDPNFRRTILFLVRHEPSEGAMGVILNRPTDALLPDLDDDAPESLGKVAVYQGGPVESRQLILARMILVGDGTGAPRFESLERKDCEPFAGNAPEGELRAFIGYAGWEKGQLENEITEKAWAVLSPSPELLKAASSPDAGIAQWRKIMRRLGPWNHLMSVAPDDLSLN
jgi:putative transcriptional regulator